MANENMKFFNEMYVKYNNDVVKHLTHITRNIDEAQDIASDAWVKVHKHISLSTKSTYDPLKGKFNTWLFTIVNNAFIDATRKKASERKNLNPVSIVEANSSDYDIANTVICNDYASNLVESKELNTRLDKAFMNLKNHKPIYFCVADLFLRQDMSYDKIAEILDIPLNTVKVTLMRSKEMLKEAMSMRYSLA